MSHADTPLFNLKASGKGGTKLIRIGPRKGGNGAQVGSGHSVMRR